MFRTSIGFHDAYVAAPSRAAALKAWGANTDLFAAGSAEIVEGEALTAEPLSEPGKVFKKSRGTAAEHLSAVGNATARDKASQESADSWKRRLTMTHRPSRAALDKAEANLEVADRDHESSVAFLEAKTAILRKEREKLVTKYLERRRNLERENDTAREAYDTALEKWRTSTG